MGFGGGGAGLLRRGGVGCAGASGAVPGLRGFTMTNTKWVMRRAETITITWDDLNKLRDLAAMTRDKTTCLDVPMVSVEVPEDTPETVQEVKACRVASALERIADCMERVTFDSYDRMRETIERKVVCER